MCHYCSYLVYSKSSSSSSSSSSSTTVTAVTDIYDDNQYFPHYFKRYRTQSYQLTVPLCLVSLTLFFILLNITLVLSQSSNIQQHERDQSSKKILQENSRGKTKRKSNKYFILFYQDNFFPSLKT